MAESPRFQITPRDAPLLLWLGMWWCAFMGGYTLIGLLLVPLGADLPGFGLGDVAVGSQQFFRDLRGIAFIPIAPVLLLIAYSLFTRREWSRILIFSTALGAWAVMLLAAVLAATDWVTALSGIMVPAIVWWYLYRHERTATYYRRMHAASTSVDAGV